MKTGLKTVLMKLQFLFLLGIVVTQVLGQTAVSSLLFTMTFFLTAVLWAVTATRRISRMQLLGLLIVMAACVSVAVDGIRTNTAVSFSYLKKLMMFCSTVLFFGTMGEYVPDRNLVMLLFRGNTFLAVFLAGMYLMQGEQMYFWKGRVSNYLTFGFTNPNLAAVFLSAICILESIRFFTGRKLIHLALAGIMGLFVWKTQSRNAQLLLLFFWASCLVLGLFRKETFRFPAWMAWLIGAVPFIFAVGYVRMIQSPVIQQQFAFLTGDGKGLDSRVGIWQYAFETACASPLLGAYSQISTAQMHNSHLDILVSYGGPVLMLVCIFLAQIVRKEKMGKASFLCQMGFGALLLSGLGEAMLFSGGLGIYLYAGILRMLANYEFHREGRKI